jgi:hypothetical protein
MHYLKNYNKKIIFFLGFFSALPFFFIPYKPFIYINKYYNDGVWDGILTLYPGYTASLGLASPFLLVFLAIFFFFRIFFVKNIIENLKLKILGGLLVISNILILFFLSSSLKSLGASASLLGLFMILILMNNFNFKIFCTGFLISLFFFINLHALSIVVNGIKFSYSIHGTSIFGIEIYQSLVSYINIISFFFGTLILKKKFFSDFLNFKNKRIYSILYYITLISCFIIIIIAARRLAFILCLFSILVWFFKYFKKKKIYPFKVILTLTTLSTIIFFINKFFFQAKRAINYEEMVRPRLDVIVDSITGILSSTRNDILFGKLSGWGNVESSFANLFLYTGIIGLFIYLFTFIFLIYLIYRNIDNLVLKNNILYIFFAFIFLLITNIVINTISTPYFLISFFIIFITSISLKKHSTSI